LKPDRGAPLPPGREVLLDLPPPGRAPPPVRPGPWNPVRPAPPEGGLAPPGRGTPVDVNAALPPACGFDEVREGDAPSRLGGKLGFPPVRPSGFGLKLRPAPWAGRCRSPLKLPEAGLPERGPKRRSAAPCPPVGRSPRGLKGFRSSKPSPSAAGRGRPGGRPGGRLGNAGRSKRGLPVPPVAGRSRNGRCPAAEDGGRE